jgi:hypothetical protein
MLRPAQHDKLTMSSLQAALAKFDSLTNGQCRPQAAALTFDSTGDPRRAWVEYFPHYVNANRSFYASGQIPPKTRLTIPE